MRHARTTSRRQGRVAALLLATAMVVTACGGDGDDTEATGTDAETEAQDTSEETDAEDDSTEAAGDAEFTIRFSSIFGPESGLQQQLDWYMDEVEARTDGRVVFERFYAASLLGASETLPGIAEGRAEAGYLVPAYAPADLPLWNVTFVPTQGANPEAIARAQADMAENNEALMGEYEGAGIKMLAYNMIADLGTIATADPITDVSEVEGLDIRALGYLANALQLRGINPVVVEAQETYESIERGVIDGAGGFAIDVLTSEGLEEVAPWMVKIDIGGWVGAGLAINADFYEQLPDDVKQVMDEVGEEFYDQALQILMDVEEAACDTLLEAGGGVTVLPEDQSAAWRDDIGDSLWELWRSDAASSGASEDEVSSIEQAWRENTEEYAAQSEYESGLDLCAERSELPS